MKETDLDRIIRLANALLGDLVVYDVIGLMKQVAEHKNMGCLYDEVFYDIKQLDEACKGIKNR